MLLKREYLWLWFILLLGLIIRFLYFPNNIYFGYDQARDAFASLEIVSGKLKLVGPTTSFEGLNHGVLYYYLLAPAYFLGGKSPEFTAAFLRILNALGVFLIFYLASLLFNKKVGIFAALIFAFSFEQTQFAIYMGNPAPASISVLLMYLGLALVIFNRKYFGLPLAFLGLGASIQFQFALLYLIVPFVLIIAFFHKSFLKVPFKIIIFSLLVFLFSISTFLISEIRSNFRMFNALIFLSGFNPDKNIFTIFNSYFYTVSRMVTFNIYNPPFPLITILFLLFFIFFLLKKEYFGKLVFLAIWFFSIFATFIVHGGSENLQRDVPLYYPNVGVSASLVIFISFLIYQTFLKARILAVVMVALVLTFNLTTITSLNPKGTISEIDVQQGMLLSDQKQIIDYLYKESGNQPFAVKAVTLPFFINTTWSYLFEWYGKNTYGYLPVWNGKNALGYAGNLSVEEAQEKLPDKRFLIIEPVRGIPAYLIEEYIKEEGYFTNMVDQKTFGDFVVQKRVKY